MGIIQDISLHMTQILWRGSAPPQCAYVSTRARTPLGRETAVFYLWAPRSHWKSPGPSSISVHFSTDTVTPCRGLHHREHSGSKEGNAEVTGGHRLWGSPALGDRDGRDEKAAGEKGAPPTTPTAECSAPRLCICKGKLPRQAQHRVTVERPEFCRNNEHVVASLCDPPASGPVPGPRVLSNPQGMLTDRTAPVPDEQVVLDFSTTTTS